MTFFATLCLFDDTVGSNLFWHGSLLFSKLNEETRRIELVKAWGYYGMPLLSNMPHSIKEWMAAKIGFTVDIEKNHGWVMYEEYRYMALGHGLHGDTFELTENEFNMLLDNYAERFVKQQEAVNEILPSTNITTEKKPKRYVGEEHAREIFAEELRRAKEQGREPRLQPFDLHLSWGLMGPSMEESHTCKRDALDMLGRVIEPELVEPYKASTFPRFVSGNMEKILLHYEGPLDKHIKASGQAVYFPNGDRLDTRLIWTVPPQNITGLADSNVRSLFTIDKDYIDEIKTLASKLQQIEWVIINAITNEKYSVYRQQLIAKIRASYQEFSAVEPRMNTPKISGWRGYLFTLFDLPQNNEQKNLQLKINKAKTVLNNIYHAIIDQWEEDSIDTCHEAFVACLPPNDQKKLCSIMGRHYIKCEQQSGYLTKH